VSLSEGRRYMSRYGIVFALFAWCFGTTSECVGAALRDEGRIAAQEAGTLSAFELGECLPLEHAPEVWRVAPDESLVEVQSGDSVTFAVGAMDEDCDLLYFHYVWDELLGMPCMISGCYFDADWEVDFDEGCCEYIGITICDGTGLCTSLGWDIIVTSPVSSISWGTIKALYR
jgi:hypothetical protein